MAEELPSANATPRESGTRGTMSRALMPVHAQGQAGDRAFAM